MKKSFRDVPEMLAALQPSYPVYCLRPRAFRESARAFLNGFPGRVLYAVKCNPHPEVLQMLYDAGVRHFDTASLPEIALVRELFHDAMMYFMHPVKSRAVINSAYEVYGVRHFVIDHAHELEKIVDQTGGDGVSLIVRIATPSAGAAYDLSAKFGARPAEAVDLLKAAQREGVTCGIAFHVGSQCNSTSAYRTALSVVGSVLDAAGVGIQYLDVGGGFPAPYLGVQTPPLETFFAEIEAGLRALDLRRDCVVMCEPGRALVAGGCSVVVQVQLRKDSQLYVNDGVYGSFSEAATAGIRYPVRLLRLDGEPAAEHREFTIYGPTCDSTDVLPNTFILPEDTREGDWIEAGRMGAYTNAVATRFNGFNPETFVEVADDPF